VIRRALILASFLLSLGAQVLAPGASGVSLGHLHLHSADAAAQGRFWVDVFGAVPTKVGDLTLYKLPGVFIAINAEKPTGAMEGSTVPLIGLKVDNVEATAEKANAARAKVVQDGKRMVIIGPDDIRVELTSDVDTVHINVPDIAAAEQWYAKTFGAVLGKDHSATLPGVRLLFSTSIGSPAGTKGRALDHIGLEVRDLREFTRNLAATGQKVDLMYLKLPDSGVAIAFVTDPFGTFIELTDGLIRF